MWGMGEANGCLSFRERTRGGEWGVGATLAKKDPALFCAAAETREGSTCT